MQYIEYETALKNLKQTDRSKTRTIKQIAPKNWWISHKINDLHQNTSTQVTRTYRLSLEQKLQVYMNIQKTCLLSVIDNFVLLFTRAHSYDNLLLVICLLYINNSLISLELTFHILINLICFAWLLSICFVLCDF